MDECAQSESGPVEESRADSIDRGLLGPSRLARSLRQAGVYIKTATLRFRVGRRFGLHACFCSKRERVARLVFGQCLARLIEKSWKLACDTERRRQSRRHLRCGIGATACAGIKSG